MAYFVERCGLVLVATLLATTGGFHLLHLRRVAGVLDDHGIVRRARPGVAAFVLTMSELAIAAIALVALTTGEWRIAAVASSTALAAGLGFVMYLHRLLQAGHSGSCGCTPLDAALTPASFAPAVALAAAGALGLSASLVGGSDPVSGAAWTALPVAWGLALTGLVVLLPATAPQLRPTDASEPSR